MLTVAEQLRRAREEQKLTVYQVAEITKIKTDHIRALEAGRYETFAAPVYIRGFVRTYAKALKLDVAQLSETLDTELGQTKKFREPPSLSNEPRSALDVILLRLAQLKWQRWAPVLAVFLIIGGGVLAFRSCQTTQKPDPLKNLGPGLYKPPRSTNSGDLLPVPGR
ncbi:MAG TPA: helix-turn-helix domain-containing protein [Verrucomicrobiae bacterium]|nr:helix-turn-helix domain-containing protein [Verrucomicrobiae bacterium]